MGREARIRERAYRLLSDLLEDYSMPSSEYTPWPELQTAIDDVPPLIAIDFDGVVTENYDNPSFDLELMPGAREGIQKLRSDGWFVILWTVRENNQSLRDYLDSHGLEFDAINESPYQPPESSQKIKVDLYVDDRNFEQWGNGFSWDLVLEKADEVLKRLRSRERHLEKEQFNFHEPLPENYLQ